MSCIQHHTLWLISECQLVCHIISICIIVSGLINLIVNNPWMLFASFFHNVHSVVLHKTQEKKNKKQNLFGISARRAIVINLLQCRHIDISLHLVLTSPKDWYTQTELTSRKFYMHTHQKHRNHILFKSSDFNRNTARFPLINNILTHHSTRSPVHFKYNDNWFVILTNNC